MSKQPIATTEPAPLASVAKSLVPKLKIAGIIAGVIVLEWVVAYFYLPSSLPNPAAATAHERHEMPAETAAAELATAQESTHASSHELPAKPGAHVGQQEVDLGAFTVTAFQPVASSTLFISFHLYGTVQQKHHDEFSKRLDESKHRVRDNVIVIIRSAEITDLTDAGLGLIKRRILETTNKTLGKPLLQGVVFSEFSFVEQ